MTQSLKAHNRPFLGAIVKQSQWVFAGKIVFALLGIGASILLARILGPASLGRYQLGLTVVQIVTILTVLGFDGGLIRFLPILQIKDSAEAWNLLSLNIKISLTLSIVLTIVLYVIAPIMSIHYFHSERMTEALRSFSFYIPLLTVFQISGGAVIGIKRADMQSNITNILTPLVFLITLLMIYFWKGGLLSCIFARSITCFLGIVVLMCFIRKSLCTTAPIIEKSLSFRRYLSYSVPLMLIGIIYLILGQMDIIMLGYFMPESEVGIYSVALKIATFVIFGLQVIIPIIRPYFSELSEKNDFSTIEVIFKTSTRWLFYSGLFVFCLILILRLEILSVFGTEFIVGGNILLILSLGHLANTISGPTGQLLIMSGGEKWEVLNSFLVILLNFFLNIFLIQKMGTVGAAIATTISISLINTLKLAEVYIIYKMHPYSLKLINGALAILSGSLVGYFIRSAALNLSLGVIIILPLVGSSFIIVSSVVFWAFGLDEEDKVLFKRFLGR